MLVYYLIWSLLFILSYCEIISFKDYPKRLILNRNIIFLLLITFIIIAGLKGNVGTDYASYKEVFERTYSEKNYSYLNAIEPGFWIWMKFISLLGLNFAAFWFITCFFNISLKFYIFSKLSPYISISLSIYFIGLFFERDFDGIRQGIAIGISYLGIYYYLKHKYIRFYLAIILAFSIHYTSIIFLFVPLLSKWEIPEKKIYLIIVFALLLLISNIYLINETTISLLGNNFITARILNYIAADEYGKQTGFSIGILFRLILLLLFIRYRNKIKIEPKLYILLRNGLLFAILCALLFNNVDILSHRVAYGFREFQIFIFAYLITAFKRKSDKLIVSSIILFYSLVLLYRLLNTEHLTSYYLYKTIFNQ